MHLDTTFVTSNPHKLAEAQAILGDGVTITQSAIDLEEIQGVELEEVARHKGNQAYDKLRRPFFCEDTSLHIEQLNGFPGALIKWYLERVGVHGISRLHGGSPAYAKTAVAYHDCEKLHLFSGKIEGIIAPAPQGQGFGWSTIFIPFLVGEHEGKSFAELPITYKNTISMRSKALKAMLNYLRPPAD